MKRIKSIISVVCSIAILFSISTNSLATYVDGQKITLDPNSSVSYEELPSYVQPYVHNNDLVTVTDGNHYHIFLAAPDSPSVSLYSRQYEPDGGTLTFSDPIISSDIYYIEYQLNVTYIPYAVLSNYLINYYDTSLIGSIKSAIKSMGVSVGVEWAANLIFERTGLQIPATAIVFIIEVGNAQIANANFNELKNAFNYYVGMDTTAGLFVDTHYMHNRSIQNGSLITTYSKWDGKYIDTSHDGKVGTFKPGVYYAGGTWF